LRSEYLRENIEHKREAENRIASIVKVANREARDCLSENTNNIKMENQKLRAELLELIQITKDLNKHKEKLNQQKEELSSEIKYAEDLTKIRSTRQQRFISRILPNS
jgi:argininosuccinate lyase